MQRISVCFSRSRLASLSWFIRFLVDYFRVCVCAYAWLARRHINWVGNQGGNLAPHQFLSTRCPRHSQSNRAAAAIHTANCRRHVRTAICGWPPAASTDWMRAVDDELRSGGDFRGSCPHSVERQRYRWNSASSTKQHAKAIPPQSEADLISGQLLISCDRRRYARSDRSLQTLSLLKLELISLPVMMMGATSKKLMCKLKRWPEILSIIHHGCELW